MRDFLHILQRQCITSRKIYHLPSVPIENRVCESFINLHPVLGFKPFHTWSRILFCKHKRINAGTNKQIIRNISMYPPEDEQKSVRVSIIGKPNVGM